MKKILSVCSFMVAFMMSIVAFAQSPSGKHAIILSDICIECGSCVRACPVGAIKAGSPYTVDRSKCTGCGACMDECPVGAIWMEEFN